MSCMRKRLVFLALSSLVALSACAPVETPQAAPRETTGMISISGFAFAPKTFEAAVGDRIVWTNEDDIAHTVTSGKAKEQGVPGVSENQDAQPDGVFDGGTLELNDTFEFTFEQTGTFTYFCAIHAGMKARVVIR